MTTSLQAVHTQHLVRAALQVLRSVDHVTAARLIPIGVIIGMSEWHLSATLSLALYNGARRGKFTGFWVEPTVDLIGRVDCTATGHEVVEEILNENSLDYASVFGALIRIVVVALEKSICEIKGST